MNGDKDVVAIYDYIYQATIETFEWEILKKKKILKILHITFLMIWSILETLTETY